jgi:hypothetical protein
MTQTNRRRLPPHQFLFVFANLTASIVDVQCSLLDRVQVCRELRFLVVVAQCLIMRPMCAVLLCVMLGTFQAQSRPLTKPGILRAQMLVCKHSPPDKSVRKARARRPESHLDDLGSTASIKRHIQARPSNPM